MNACKNNAVKPALEALEDRYMPSTTPLSMLNPPIMNAMANYVNAFSQQAQAALAAYTQASQAVQAPGINVVVNSGVVRPNQGGSVVIGHVWVDSKYLNGNNLKSNLHFEAGYHWGPELDPAFTFKAPFGLVAKGGGWFDIVTDRSFFRGQPNYVTLQVRIEIQEGRSLVTGNQGMGGWVVNPQFAGNQNQTNPTGQSAIQNPMEDVNSGNHAEIVEMSLSDRFFTALGSQAHPDGLPIITSGDWGV